ncbi:uncharacterized protein LOC134229989 [Saccostrea cucullata]|uniref:uncharacterized protein LOC134229989 n=1 Tax=Saccostrea cuccullata TaxID=36930 RepID=UPI002ED13C01
MFHNSEEENTSCLEEMRKFSSFSLETEIKSINHKKIKERLKKLEQDIEYGYGTIEETICFHNFVSYLHWTYDEKEKAMELAIKAVELGSKCTFTATGVTDNIITLCNLFHFHKENGNVAESRKFIERFKELSKRDDFQELKYIAKAELAVCMSKLGPFYLTKSIKMFRESVDKMSTFVDCWQFHFALTLNRKAHLLNIQNKKDTQDVDDDKEAYEKFKKIIECTSSKILKSNSLCEVGFILYNHHNEKDKYENLNYMEYFEEAIEINPQSYHALERYGQILRYQKNLQKSNEILERSLKVRKTPAAYHHLGLTFQKMVLEEHYEKKKKRSQLENMSRQDSTKVDGLGLRSGSSDKSKTIRDSSQIRAKMKSCRYVLLYPGDERLLNAEQNLEKALLMDISFDNARYDLGLVQRSLGKPNEALKTFRYITNSYKGKSSNQIQLILAYEQQAFCKLDLFKTNDNENDIIDAVDALNRALDILTLYIDSFPELKSACTCVQVIEEIKKKYECCNLGKENSNDIHDFASLYEKSHEYKKAYDLYSKCEPKTRVVYQKMVESLKAAGDYENAIGILNRLIINKDPNTPPGQFIFQMYSDAAFYSIENRKFEETKMRLLQCQKCIPTWENHDNCIDEDDVIDFYILHHCEERCPLAEKLVRLLTESFFVKFNVTLNADECLPGRTISKYYKDTIKRANFILFFYHENPLKSEDNDGIIIEKIQEDPSMGSENNVLNVILGDAEQPWRHPAVVLPNDFATAEEEGKEDNERHVLEGRLILDILRKTYALQERKERSDASN